MGVVCTRYYSPYEELDECDVQAWRLPSLRPTQTRDKEEREGEGMLVMQVTDFLQ